MPGVYPSDDIEPRFIVEESTLEIVKPEDDLQVMAFYNQAIELKDHAESRVIATNKDLEPANDDLSIIRRVKKGMEEKRKEYLRPFQDHVKETNEAYKSLMEPIEQADKITSGKMLAFTAEQDSKRREAERIEQGKLRLAREETELKGEHTVDLTPVEKPEAVPDRIRTEMGTSSQRDNWKWEVTDFSLVPDEYKMINPAVVTPAAKSYKDTRTIPGIRIFNEPIIAVNTR